MGRGGRSGIRTCDGNRVIGTALERKLHGAREFDHAYSLGTKTHVLSTELR